MSAREELIKLDSQVKETHKRKIEAIREAIWQKELDAHEARYNDALVKHKNSRLKKDETGETISDWELSNRAAKRSASSEAAAYNSEWKMCMLNLLSTYSKMADALGNTVKEHFTLPIQKWLTSPASKGKYSGHDMLPVLIQEVNLNEEDVLEVKLFNKDDPKYSFNKNFREAVVVWLAEKGYIQDAEQKGKFTHTDGERLTQKRFNELKPQFSEFLTSNSQLSYESPSVDQEPGFRP
ncbi:MAG: hypothetical protein CK426_03945 [Legionella sp.]|nr:MAG: hypothetical protein CK423_02945 [Legionella sp.]PJD98978.1 MAG: hypothetical protein CK426_03945 [Legionella sp.]